MQALVRHSTLLRNDSCGVTTIEYAVISALLVLAIVTALSVLTTDLSKAMSQVAKAIVTRPLLP